MVPQVDTNFFSFRSCTRMSPTLREHKNLFAVSMSPHVYILQLRLKKATANLRSSELHIPKSSLVRRERRLISEANAP